jgi:elongation factor G
MIMGGVDEAHLDRKADLLLHDHKLDLSFGVPQVAYRETLGRKAVISYTHKKHLGPMSQFAGVRIIFEPVEAGAGYSFENRIADGSVPREFVPGVERGLLQARENGLLAGFPVIDFKATLVDGKYHDIDSSIVAFEIAARAAFRELLEKASPKLLEPIMKVEVTTPEDRAGDVIGDLNSRRGMIQSVDQRGATQAVIANVPLASMFGYANTLRAISQGWAEFTMRYDRYETASFPEPPDNLFPSAIGMRA